MTTNVSKPSAALISSLSCFAHRRVGSQRDSRVSLWQTGYPTDTPQFRLIAQLNGIRRRTRHGSSVRLVHATGEYLIGVRTGCLLSRDGTPKVLVRRPLDETAEA